MFFDRFYTHLQIHSLHFNFAGILAYMCDSRALSFFSVAVVVVTVVIILINILLLFKVIISIEI